jgi:hypothetical protein
MRTYNEALRPKGRSLHSSFGGILRSRKPRNASADTDATRAFIPALERAGFSAKEDKQNREVLYGWQHEKTFQKVRRFLNLTPQGRYLQMARMSEFILAARKGGVKNNVHRTFKTLQVLKQT